MRALTAEPDGNVDRVSSASSTGPLTSITSTFHAKDINHLNYNDLIKIFERLRRRQRASVSNFATDYLYLNHYLSNLQMRDLAANRLSTESRSANPEQHPMLINHMGAAMSNIAVPCAAVAAITP